MLLSKKLLDTGRLGVRRPGICTQMWHSTFPEPPIFNLLQGYLCNHLHLLTSWPWHSKFRSKWNLNVKYYFKHFSGTPFLQSILVCAGPPLNVNECGSCELSSFSFIARRAQEPERPSNNWSLNRSQDHLSPRSFPSRLPTTWPSLAGQGLDEKWTLLWGFECLLWKLLVNEQTLIPDYIKMMEAITCS